MLVFELICFLVSWCRDTVEELVWGGMVDSSRGDVVYL
jgi:hypothetical protein